MVAVLSHCGSKLTDNCFKLFKSNVIIICHGSFFSLFVDYSKGFGGKYGVQKDRVDKVLLKHASPTVFLKNLS